VARVAGAGRRRLIAALGVAVAVTVVSVGALRAMPVGDPVPDLVVDKTGPAVIAPGGTVRYGVTVTNTGGATAVDVVLTDTLPAPLVFDSASRGGREVAPGVVRWALGLLPETATRVLTLTASVPMSATVARVENVAVARASNDEPDLGDNTARRGSDLLPVDLRVSIAPTAAEVRPGEDFTHSVTVANVSALAAEDVVVDVTLATGTTFVTDTLSHAAPDFTRALTPGGVRWSLDRAAGPSSWTIDLVTRVKRNVAPGTVLAHVASVTARTLDNEPANNMRTSVGVPVVVPDLWLVKTGPAEIGAGGDVTYTLRYGNDGVGGAPGAGITDTLPAALAFVSSLPAATVLDTRTLRWDLGRVPVGAQDVIRVRARVDARVGATVINTATIGAPAPDADGADNQNAARSTVVAGAPARVSIDAPAELVVGGGQGTIRVTVDDAVGNPVADGTAVVLDTSLGRLGSTNLRSTGGRVTTTLTAESRAGTAHVSARSGAITAAADVAFAPGDATTVTVALDPVVATAGQTVTVTIDVADSHGNPVRDGTVVAVAADRGQVTPGTATLVGGRAVVAWRATLAGAGAIRATVDAATGSAAATFRPGPVAIMAVAVTPGAIGVDGGAAEVRATVRDRFANGVADGTTVAFAATGGVLGARSVATRAGVAAVTYRAGERPGLFTVSATVGGVRADGSTEVRPADLGVSSRVVGPRGPSRTSKTYPGEHLTYAVTAHNHDLGTARHVYLGAALDDAFVVTSVDATLPVTPTTSPPPGLDPDSGEDQVARFWALPDLAPGEAITITLGGTLERSHDWTALQNLFFRSVITTTTAEASITDLAHTDLAAVYAADRFVSTALNNEASNVRPGGRLVYEILFGNNTAGDDGVMWITDTLPAGTTFDQWQPGFRSEFRPIGTMDASSRELTWAVDASAARTGSLRLWLDIDPDVPLQSVLENSVRIGGSVYDLNPDNDVATDGGVWMQGVNLATQVDAPEVVAPGDVLRYRVRLRNQAPVDPASDVVVEARPPVGLVLLRTDPPGLVQADGRVLWHEEWLAAGGESLLALDVQVPENATVGNLHVFAVDATSREPESQPGDNRAEHRTRVVPGEAGRVTVMAAETVLVACGAASTRITAEVRDRFGNPVADGTVVHWSSTGGTLQRFASETAGGTTSVTLAAARRPGTAQVTARAGSVSAVATVGMVPGPPKALAVAADPNIAARGARVMISVNVLDACGNTVADGWPIVLSAERGTFEGGTGVVTLRTTAGQVRVRLRVGETPGVLIVQAAFGTERGQTVVTVADRAPRAIIYLPVALR
jgi:uncharacterized repeat protein (TIGR01451 family)